MKYTDATILALVLASILTIAPIAGIGQDTDSPAPQDVRDELSEIALNYLDTSLGRSAAAIDLSREQVAGRALMLQSRMEAKHAELSAMHKKAFSIIRENSSSDPQVRLYSSLFIVLDQASRVTDFLTTDSGFDADASADAIEFLQKSAILLSDVSKEAARIDDGTISVKRVKSLADRFLRWCDSVDDRIAVSVYDDVLDEKALNLIKITAGN